MPKIFNPVMKDLTLLCCVAEKLLGPPIRISADGRRTWRCPSCGDEKGRLVTYTPCDEFKDGWRCNKCLSEGDIHDFLKIADPFRFGSFDTRLDYLFEQENQFEKLVAEYTKSNTLHPVECGDISAQVAQPKRSKRSNKIQSEIIARTITDFFVKAARANSSEIILQFF